MRTLSLLTCVFSSGVLFAGPITVVNASFETFNPLNFLCSGANCAFNQDAIPGWTSSGSTGSFRPGNPSNTNYFDSLPDGQILAYSNGPAIEQVVGATVQFGLTYTLMVDVGWRKDLCCLQTGTVALVIGNTEFTAPSVAAPIGGFATQTVVYTAEAEPGSALLVLAFSAVAIVRSRRR